MSHSIKDPLYYDFKYTTAPGSFTRTNHDSPIVKSCLGVGFKTPPPNQLSSRTETMEIKGITVRRASTPVLSSVEAVYYRGTITVISFQECITDKCGMRTRDGISRFSTMEREYMASSAFSRFVHCLPVDRGVVGQ